MGPASETSGSPSRDHRGVLWEGWEQVEKGYPVRPRTSVCGGRKTKPREGSPLRLLNVAGTSAEGFLVPFDVDLGVVDGYGPKGQCRVL